METAQLEASIYSALKSDKELMELLPKGESSIFHYKAPSVYPELPILVYSVLSDTPELHGDNLEKLHRVTIRIHIVTMDGDYPELYSEVKKIMEQLEFTRLQTTAFIDEDEKLILVADFKKIIGG